MNARVQLGKSQRWVVKIGSALLTNDGRGLNKESIAGWVAQMALLRKRGVELVLVSSGAVAEGMTRLGWSKRPNALHELQAAAAVGQMGLVQTWESAFQQHNLHTAQVLLTHDDLSNRGRYLNARSTLRTLVEMQVVPVINENDTVVTDEIRFGDNDTLGALVANLIEADLLVILTDQKGLYDADPRQNPEAKLVPEVQANDARLDVMVGGAGTLGRGGMITKLRAARLAARSGAATIIAPGRTPGALDMIAAGEPIGTVLLPDSEPIAARKQWIAGHLQVRGRLVLDSGAVRVLREQGRSLLAVGVKTVEGNFARGEMVSCVDEANREVARGLVNYGAADTRRIQGQPSGRIEEVLGFVGEPELIHRDNMVVL
jgi:glutamate 5-kinase